MRVIFASSNLGKINELQSLLKDTHIQIIPQTELDVEDVPETGLSFVENALIKARHACTCTGLPSIADDSGLSVSALQGEPGIYSARYAGPNAKSQDNINKLLSAMEDVPKSERTASFHCVLVYMAHALDPTPLICHGVWSGHILTHEQGKDGFGYDPVFYLESDNKTAAELSPERKNLLSHRGQAMRKLLALLQETICKP